MRIIRLVLVLVPAVGLRVAACDDAAGVCVPRVIVALKPALPAEAVNSRDYYGMFARLPSQSAASKETVVVVAVVSVLHGLRPHCWTPAACRYQTFMSIKTNNLHL